MNNNPLYKSLRYFPDRINIGLVPTLCDTKVRTPFVCYLPIPTHNGQLPNLLLHPVNNIANTNVTKPHNGNPPPQSQRSKLF